MQEIIDKLSQDKHLQTIIAETKLSALHPDKDVYISLLRAIIGQQLSTKAASTIYKRFLALFENYPDAQNLANTDFETLREVGLSKQKITYVQNVAKFDLEKGLDYESLANMSNEEIIKYLTEIKGVGKWTVEMLLMMSLGRLDVFPVDDLGIQQAMRKLYEIEEPDKKKFKAQLQEIAQNWQPYRSIACRYLWKWKDNTK